MIDTRLIFVGIHGVFTAGESSTDRLLDEIRALGGETVEWDWGPRPPVFAKLFVDAYAWRLNYFLNKHYPFRRVVLLGHSFGTKIAARVMQIRHVHRAWLFNSPLPANVDLRLEAERIHVVANRRDPVLRMARRFLGWMGFGDLGRMGYQGPQDMRVFTWWEELPKTPAHQQHGASLRWPLREIWAQRIFKDAGGQT